MYIPVTDDFDAMAYGAPHPGTMQYIAQKFENLSTNLTQFGRDFMADAHSKWDYFMGSEAMRRARAVRSKIEGALFMRNEVQPLHTLSAIQNAAPMMQRWIMSEPTTRQLYHDQRIEGFAGSYVDPFPGEIKDEDYNYRRVMTGVVEEVEDGEWKARIYLDDLLPGDTALAIDQKSDILGSWAAVRALLDYGKEDPTSVTNSMM